MTDPTAHNSPSERDDDREDACRDSCPPETNETAAAPAARPPQQHVADAHREDRARIGADVMTINHDRAQLATLGALAPPAPLTPIERRDIALRMRREWPDAASMAWPDGFVDPDAPDHSSSPSGLPALLRAIAKADRTTYAPGDPREWDRPPPPDGSPRWSTPRELACAALNDLHRRGIISAREANWRAADAPAPAVSPETRDPNPTVPGSPGERRMRRG